MGRHSLIATRLISLIYKEFQVNILINELFKNVRLEDFAVLIDNIKITSISMRDIDDQSDDNIETEFFSI